MNLCTKFERNREIRGGVTAISIFDLMTSNAMQRVALGSWDNFHQVWLRQLMGAWIIAFLC